MLLPILPETIRIPLGDDYPGLVAVARPLDVEDKARWYDEASSAQLGTTLALVACVRRQLVTIEGLTAQAEGGEPVPFDGQNPAHFRSLPTSIIVPIFNALMDRSNLSETQQKN